MRLTPEHIAIKAVLQAKQNMRCVPKLLFYPLIPVLSRYGSFLHKIMQCAGSMWNIHILTLDNVKCLINVMTEMIGRIPAVCQ